MNIIQQTINWLENKLEEPVRNEEVVQVTGYSFYHFHRLFQQKVGMSLHEYVRNRRLTIAAQRLIYTNERILDIAFTYQFESQEAFTRAFRKAHGLPPGEYRMLMRTLLENPKEVEVMKGWFISGTNPQSYEMGRDFQEVHKGNASGYLRSVMATKDEEFGTVMQQFQASKYCGKRLKLSCFIKSMNIDGFAGLWMRIDAKDGDTLQFDNMSNRPIKGTTGWNHYSVVLDVPPNAGVIYFGVLLQGSGSIWMDEFAFEEVDDKTPTTNLNTPDSMPAEPVNLNFDLELE
ncbi:helix-turn-helix transcriptional regulator [Psychrobacillus sp. FSL K6-1267]|uniref:helix-turn-helix transcriptional regulator n=1 Tax=Psychrobacillus sp. FSL K6-1267 TaxID=2921543 RepID=UPI0030F7A40C